MGPHPKRKLITLPVKAPSRLPQDAIGAPSDTPQKSPKPLDQKAVNGPTTATGAVRVAATLQPGSTAAPSPSVSTLSASTTAVQIAAARARRIARDAASDWLGREYPLAFGPTVKPLAIGIGRALWPAAEAAGITHRALGDALKRRTNSPAYLEALAADGAMRIGLDGDAVGPVDIEHQVFALDRLADIERSWARRSAAPAEARP
jgi:hypothetical protein